MIFLTKTFKVAQNIMALSFAMMLCVSLAHAQTTPVVQASTPTPAQIAEQSAPQIQNTQPFTVTNVLVDIKADNALKAREQAFEQAQVKAFEALAKQRLTTGAPFTPPPAATIAPMIDDYEVADEKLSRTRYIGTYTIRFNEQSVRQYLEEQGAQIAALPEKPLLILPFLEKDGHTLLWSPDNAWMHVWTAATDLGEGAQPLLLPIGDLNDVADIGDDTALTYNPARLAALTKRYGAERAVLAIAKQNYGNLYVQLYSTDKGPPAYITGVTVPANPALDETALYTAGIKAVREALAGQDWQSGKSTAQDSASQTPEPDITGDLNAHQGLQARVSFSSLQEWAAVQRALARVQGLNDITLKTLSPQEAVLELIYQGDVQNLTYALSQAGLTLGAVEISGSGAPTYPLRLKSSSAPQPPQEEPPTPSSAPSYERQF